MRSDVIHHMVDSVNNGNDQARTEALAAGLVVVRHGGVKALSFRRIATEVGCSPEDLVHEFSDEMSFLSVLISYASGDFYLTPEELPAEAQIVSGFVALRRSLEHNDWILDCLQGGVFVPRVGLQFCERVMALFHQVGVTGIAAFQAYRSLWFHTAGHVAFSVAYDDVSIAQREKYLEMHDFSDLPFFCKLMADLAEPGAEGSFEAAIARHVRGIIVQHSSGTWADVTDTNIPLQDAAQYQITKPAP